MSAKDSCIFKFNANTSETMRERRRRHQIELRKQNREMNNLKRRIPTLSRMSLENELIDIDGYINNIIEKIRMGENLTSALHSLGEILVNREYGQKAITTIIQSRDIIYILSNIIKTSIQQPQLQFEAAWCLTNLLSGESEVVMICLDCNVYQALICALKNMDYSHIGLVEQVIWALGNICASGGNFRDMVVNDRENDFIIGDICKPIFHSNSVLSIIRTSVWTLSTFCCTYPNPPSHPERLIDLVKIFTYLIANTSDKLILTDASKCIRDILYVCGEEAWKRIVKETNQFINITSRFIKNTCDRLNSDDDNEDYTLSLELATIIMDIYTEIVVLGNYETNEILESDEIMSSLYSFLLQGNTNLKYHACILITTILSSGETFHIKKIFDSGIINLLAHTANPEHSNSRSNLDLKIRMESVWALCNIVISGHKTFIHKLVNMKPSIIPFLTKALDTSNDNIVHKILSALYIFILYGNLNKNDEGYNPCLQEIQESGGFYSIEMIQSLNHSNSSNAAILEIASSIIELISE
jgi:hypothetical protein